MHLALEAYNETKYTNYSELSELYENQTELLGNGNESFVNLDRTAGSFGKWGVWVYLLLCITGIISTTVSIIVLTRPKMRSSSMNALLAILESACLLFLIIYSQSLILRIAFAHHISNKWLNNWFSILASVCPPFMIFFNWTTVAISFWRVFAITWPFRSKTLLTTKRAAVVMSMIALLSVLQASYVFMIPKPSNDYIKHNRNLYLFGSRFDPTKGIKKDKRTLFNMFRLCAYITGFLLPFTCSVLAIGYLLTSLFLVKRRQLRLTEGQKQLGTGEARSTSMLVALLAAFLLSYVSPVFLAIQQLIRPGKLSVLPLCLNMCLPVLLIHNLTIVIYYKMSVKFRVTFHEVFKLPNRRN